MLRQPRIRLHPAFAPAHDVAVHAADMRDQHRFRPQFHVIENLGLRRQIGAALGGQRLVGAVEQDELRGVERKAQILRLRLHAKLAQFRAAFLDLSVELWHVWVSHVRREIGADPVHSDIVFRQIHKNGAQICQADAQMGIILPAPRVVRGQIGLAQHFHRKSKPHVNLLCSHRGHREQSVHLCVRIHGNSDAKTVTR